MYKLKKKAAYLLLILFISVFYIINWGGFNNVGAVEIPEKAETNVEQNTELENPEITKFENFKGYIQISWEKIDLADGYVICRCDNGSEWKELARIDANKNIYTDSSVKNGQVYSYRVCSVKGGSISPAPTYDGATQYLEAPVNVKAINSYYNGNYITWNRVAGAVKYRIYRKEASSSNWQLVAATANCSYQDTNLKNNTQYFYIVKVEGSNGAVSYGSAEVVNLVVHKPAVTTLHSKPEGILVSWSRVDGALGYRVYRRAAGEKNFQFVKKLYGIDNRCFIDTAAKKGQYYAYTIRAVNGVTFGGFSKRGVYTKFMGAPIVSASHSPNGIVLKWSVPSVGSSYQVQRKVQGEGNYKTIGVINNMKNVTYTDAKPVYGKYNYYRIIVAGARYSMTNTASAFGIDSNKKMVALTYDDGPNTTVTNSILGTLQKYNSRATFFVVGSRVPTYKACIKKASGMGCEIGNHSYNHTILTSVGGAKIKSEINSTNNAVKAITGKSPVLVRTPGGAVNSTVKKNVGAPIISWNIDTLDWKSRNADSVVKNIKNNVKDGSIVLMHDLYSSTAQATKTIVPWLVSNGYQIVTVSEMYAVKGITLEKGSVYYSG